MVLFNVGTKILLYEGNIMKALDKLEPKKVFEFFEYISSVPRGSGNTGKIADLCVRFAQERGLEYSRDGLNNVVIRKPGSKGYENSPVFVIQGHLDMVCAKNDDCSINMDIEPIKLTHDDTYVFAEGTTLGGDDGIAVAYALALLDSMDITHPPIEAVFTVDEETGMDGAFGLDGALVKGRTFLNIDSEEEGIFTCGCAGGCRINGCIPVKEKMISVSDGEIFELVLNGLKGGHSGTEIDKQPASANHLMGRLLFELREKLPVLLIGINGGRFDNVICESAKACLYINKNDINEALTITDRLYSDLKNEYAFVNPDISLSLVPVSIDPYTDKDGVASVLDEDSTKKVIDAIFLSPQGVLEMSPELKDMVRTSVNLGILSLEDNTFKISFLARSMVDSQKDAVVKRITELIVSLGGTVSYQGNYPGWKYEPESPLRDKCVKVYKELYGKDPVINTIHAGLECGLFADKLDGLDAVSIGPDIFDIHTPRERLSIASVGRVWTFLLRLLEESV